MKYEQKDIISEVREPDISGTYSAADYIKWTFEGLYEIIRGKVFKMSPAPSMSHQKVLHNLNHQFTIKFEGNPCELYFAPADVYLVNEGEDYKQTKNIVEPDLMVICDKSKIKSFGCVGSPDLIVEVISQHTSKKDLKLKFDLYQEYGIKEYWTVYPKDKIVNIYSLVNGKYSMPKIFTEDVVVQSVLFPELVFELREVFKGVDEIGE